MRRLTVQHTTVYRYAAPVTLGEHRMMFRPRDSHDLRLVSTGLVIDPAPSAIRWLFDVFGNSVAIASFATQATELRFDSRVDIEHYEDAIGDAALDEAAKTYPFTYLDTELPDLVGPLTRRHSEPEIAQWARGFLADAGSSGTMDILTSMTQSVKGNFTYTPREEQGVQSPAQTLSLGSGSCRDFAFLMMEAVRSLGLAARFVSGYIYSPATDPAGGGNIGGGATHAWLQVYLPGAGWVEFDPTNGIVGNRDLIRVAVARDPMQAQPLSGSWTGRPADYLGMTVSVSVSATPEPQDAAPQPAPAAA
jgi:transglutaminase-like putative cysteine protease